MGIICGDCREILKTLPDNSIDLLCTDPPYGIKFMSKSWDKALPDKKVWQECCRVLKDGAFAFVMSIPRADCLSRMIISLEDAGFNIGFTPIFWAYASGFPKSQNIGKAADKRLGVKRDEVINEYWGVSQGGVTGGFNASRTIDGKRTRVKVMTPKSPQAKALDGSYGGFQPKPAVEVIIVAMKPLSEKTYVDQALKNKKGITWLDEGRIPFIQENTLRKPYYDNGDIYKLGSKFKGSFDNKGTKGRFPANLLVSDDVLNDGRDSKSSGFYKKQGKYKNTGQGEIRTWDVTYAHLNMYAGDSGSFSRYFDLDSWWEERIKLLPKSVQKTFPFLIVPKASKSEKNKGCEDLPAKEYERGNIIRKVSWCKKCNHLIDPIGRVKGHCQCDTPELFYKQVEIQSIKNTHPTVKPLKLMSYLITLGSLEGDVILDPFLGSGTTALACQLLSRECIGIELEEKYCEISAKRCSQSIMKSGEGEHIY